MQIDNRKKKLVHVEIQGALVKRLLLQWAIFVAATCLATMFIRFLMDPLQSRADTIYELKVTMMSFLTVSLCLIPVFLRDSLALSNRFVGPIVRVQQHIKQVGCGKLTKLQFRDGDFWRTLADDFNNMVDHLRNETSTETSDDERQVPQRV